ncbi:hypothetical protein [Niveibacterium sp. SC-1]|uniref:hypothetical protein n=1 Tax=Niveibacterium sp. SC-1 TaxID=3135646 RepID=UPI00311E4071
MAIREEAGRFVMQGVCDVEDVEPLLQALLSGNDIVLDLGPCRHLHCALVQIIARSAANLLPPEDEWLRRFVFAPLESSRAGKPAGALPSTQHAR